MNGTEKLDDEVGWEALGSAEIEEAKRATNGQ